MENKLIIEEIVRIKEIMGVSQIISEQEILKYLKNSMDVIANSFRKLNTSEIRFVDRQLDEFARLRNIALEATDDLTAKTNKILNAIEGDELAVTDFITTLNKNSKIKQELSDAVSNPKLMERMKNWTDTDFDLYFQKMGITDPNLKAKIKGSAPVKPSKIVYRKGSAIFNIGEESFTVNLPKITQNMSDALEKSVLNNDVVKKLINVDDADKFVSTIVDAISKKLPNGTPEELYEAIVDDIIKIDAAKKTDYFGFLKNTLPIKYADETVSQFLKTRFWTWYCAYGILNGLGAAYDAWKYSDIEFGKWLDTNYPNFDKMSTAEQDDVLAEYEKLESLGGLDIMGSFVGSFIYDMIKSGYQRFASSKGRTRQDALDIFNKRKNTVTPVTTDANKVKESIISQPKYSCFGSILTVDAGGTTGSVKFSSGTYTVSIENDSKTSLPVVTYTSGNFKGQEIKCS